LYGKYYAGKSNYLKIEVLEDTSAGRYKCWKIQVLKDKSAERYKCWKIQVLKDTSAGSRTDVKSLNLNFNTIVLITKANKMHYFSTLFW
jgi:hypothetical protein